MTALLIAGALLAPLASATSISLPITLRNTYSLVTVSIGTPAVDYDLLFDTGSSTSWVVDELCGTSCRAYTGYDRVTYTTDNSSTGSLTGQWGYISYLGGTTYGPAVQDVWTMSEIDNQTAAEWNQTFLSVRSSSMTYFPGEGFLGLAFSTIAEGGADTVVETLLWDSLLDEPRFGIYYGTDTEPEWRPQTSSPVYPGTLTIGGSDEEELVVGGADGMTWVPVQKLSGEYQIWRSDLFAVTGANNGVSTKTSDPGSWLVFDTGSGRPMVPPDAVESIYASIGMNWTAIINGEHIPLCEEFDDSWSVTFTLGLSEEGEDGEKTVDVTLPGNYFREPGFAHRDDACWPPFDAGDVNGFYLLGQGLLSKMYTVWDFGGSTVEEYAPRVGLGELKDEYMPDYAKA